MRARLAKICCSDSDTLPKKQLEVHNTPLENESWIKVREVKHFESDPVNINKLMKSESCVGVLTSFLYGFVDWS